MKRPLIAILTAGLLLIACACGTSGEGAILLPPDWNYSEYLKPLLDQHCVSCHQTGAVMQGDYAVDSYQALFGAGSDTVPNVQQGLPLDQSELYAILLQGAAVAAHDPKLNMEVEELRLNIAAWIAKGVSE